jgi:hypothetical protein
MCSYLRKTVSILLIFSVAFFILPSSASAWTQLLRPIFGASKVAGKEALKGGARDATKVLLKEEIRSVGNPAAGNALRQVTSPMRTTAAVSSSVAGVPWLKGKPFRFQGKEVLKRNEAFDPGHTDALGRTNVDRMRKGLAPIGKDGNPLNLHHENQKDCGRLIELTASEHRKIPVDRASSEIDREAFNKWKLNYWQTRAKDFGG